MFDDKKIDRLFWWVDNDFHVLPCQPGSKALVSGFGQYKRKLSTRLDIGKWFKFDTCANVAVLAPADVFILDFDKINVFLEWADKCQDAAQSYTEDTPRGGKHVFIKGFVPVGVSLVDGVEIKRVVLVNPSQIGGIEYKIALERPFYNGDVLRLLTPLSRIGCATPHSCRASYARARVTNTTGIIPDIKQHWTISSVLSTYLPDVQFVGHGEWQNCLCPFHDDHKPSFYFSDAIGVWGCHACNVRGDVINLYAKLEEVSVREAISRMWAVMA